jgi:hypothetical protein
MTMKAVTLYGNAARWESVQTAALLRFLREHSATVFHLRVAGASRGGRSFRRPGNGTG